MQNSSKPLEDMFKKRRKDSARRTTQTAINKLPLSSLSCKPHTQHNGFLAHGYCSQVQDRQFRDTEKERMHKQNCSPPSK